MTGSPTQKHTTLSPRGSKRNIQRPLLPTNLLLALGKPRLPPLLLKKLHGHRAPHPGIPRTHIGTRIQLSDQRRGPLINQGLQLNIFHERQRQVEDISRRRS